jgi:uncharacterized protein (TIGR03067 family)
MQTVLAGSDQAQKDLEGVWKPSRVVDNGKVENEAELADYRMTFKGNTFTVDKDGEVLIKGTYTLDPAARPKHINLKFEKSADEAEVGKTATGIYKLEGDTLTWCATKPGIENRPIDFTSKDGAGRMLVTLKRVK